MDLRGQLLDAVLAVGCLFDTAVHHQPHAENPLRVHLVEVLQKRHDDTRGVGAEQLGRAQFRYAAQCVEQQEEAVHVVVLHHVL